MRESSSVFWCPKCGSRMVDDVRWIGSLCFDCMATYSILKEDEKQYDVLTGLKIGEAICLLDQFYCNVCDKEQGESYCSDYCPQWEQGVNAIFLSNQV